MSVPLPAFRRVRLTQQCVIHPQDKGGNYLPCASEDWVLFVSLATEVLQHLNLCFADELSLTELTNRFHVSTSHMIHMFKAQFGLPPIQYMVRRRIGEAQHLLRTTEDSAGDIGGRVGMINRNYFYRMFKRLVGVSPVRYREVIGERPDMLA